MTAKRMDKKRGGAAVEVLPLTSLHIAHYLQYVAERQQHEIGASMCSVA